MIILFLSSHLSWFKCFKYLSQLHAGIVHALLILIVFFLILNVDLFHMNFLVAIIKRVSSFSAFISLYFSRISL